MQTEKVSISLSRPMAEFVAEYQKEYHCKSRSEVIQQALQLLRQKRLEKDYHDANQEIDPAFEATTFDGLQDETW